MKRKRKFKHPKIARRNMSMAQKAWRRKKQNGDDVVIDNPESVRMLACFLDAVKEEKIGYAETFRALKWFKEGWESKQ